MIGTLNPFPAFALVAVLLVGFTDGALAQGRINSQRSRYATPYMRTYTGAQSGAAYRPGVAGYPAVPARPTLPPVTGTVEKYSAVEYGQIVKMAMEAAQRNSPIGAASTTTRLVDMATTRTPSGETGYAPVSTRVSQVLDRGILLLPTGEEMRLRGVFMPSSTDTNDVLRLYAKEGVQVLSQLTGSKELYVLLDEPLRDNDGRLLGTVLLADGTELNSRMLELGYGSLRPEDFAPGVDFSDLQASQEKARELRVGIWSRR
jgi:endonuclease YncB( thermonuclease family)